MAFFLIVAAISFTIVFPYIAIVVVLVALCVLPFYLLCRSNYAGYWMLGFAVILVVLLGIANAPHSPQVEVAQQEIVPYQPTAAECANPHLHVTYFAACKAMGY